MSESFLIASAQDHKAVIIEKTPSTLDVYESGQNELICTNHYQSQSLGDSKLNQEQKQNSASVYRYERLNELLTSVHINSPSQTAAILRDYRGKGNQDIGLGNEKALNQFIAHHSIIFEPERLLAWVSTSPWQEGEYRCYDLKKIFAHPAESWTHELDEVSLRIPADPFIQTKEFAQFKQYRQLRNAYRDHTPILPMQVIQCNPHLYDAYRLAGDVYRQLHQNDSARWAYKQALQLEVATLNERHALEEKLLGLKP